MFNLAARWGWVVNATPWTLYAREEAPIPVVQEVGGLHGRSGRMRKISPPPAFFSFCPYLSVAYVYILCPHTTYSSTTHNTNIHASGGIQTRNPSQRSAAHRCLRQLGHWDRRIRPPDRPARCGSLYGMSSRGPFKFLVLF